MVTRVGVVVGEQGNIDSDAGSRGSVATERAECGGSADCERTERDLDVVNVDLPDAEGRVVEPYPRVRGGVGADVDGLRPVDVPSSVGAQRRPARAAVAGNLHLQVTVVGDLGLVVVSESG